MGRGSQCVRPSNSDHQVDAFYEPRVASGTLLRSSLSSSLLQVPSGFSGTFLQPLPLAPIFKRYVTCSVPSWCSRSFHGGCLAFGLHWLSSLRPEGFLSAVIWVARCLHPGSLFLHTRRYCGLLFLARLVPMGTATPWARFQAPSLEKTLLKVRPLEPHVHNEDSSSSFQWCHLA